MSTQTEYLGLHQWESTDNFLREDFNEDNRKIDEAVGTVQEQAHQTADTLENLSYNVCNLLLQSYYEEKYTGYKKALIFDGFRNSEGINVLQNGKWTKNYLVFGPLAVASDKSISTSNRQTATDGILITGSVQTLGYIALNFDGCGVMTELVFEVEQEDSGSEYTHIVEQVEIENGLPTDRVLANLGEVSAYAGSYGWTKLTLHPNFEIGNGQCMLRVSSVMRSSYGSNSKASLLCTMAGSDSGTDVFGPDKQLITEVHANVGYTITKSQTIASGSVEGYPCLPEQQGGAALAWVRHIGGSVELSLKFGDGISAPMSPEGSAASEDLQGAECVEQSFRLEDVGPGAVSVSLQCTFLPEEGMKLCDYGIMFL